MEAIGLLPCGFVLSEFFSQTYSFPKDANRKHHHVTLVRKGSQNDAGILYVPAAHEGIVLETYAALDVRVRVDTRDVPLTGRSVCREEQDEGQLILISG